ncbi:MBL fold metallo-hydrolase [Oceanobacillus luteolus]|uniref:ComEC/Rec2 family competence protein n=1 Tax=Oceanobacillus luteolus TaxID=1274358 RepID=A0ABW4HP72_9BACI|nr:ComEC/Rec2 family competence protein [Oceanobacillus luteolus]MCM3739518.1 MBL fold metallo-hydrolase [Oceanobacillus luteolus]
MKKLIQLLIIILIVIPHVTYTSASSPMRVHFIDVGQGDSMLIETPEDKTILIDGGEPKEGKRLVKYLKKHGIKTIDLMIATHPDFDHIGGLIEVMKHFPVSKVLENGEIRPTNTYAKYRLQLFKDDIPIKIAKENEKISVEEEVELHVLHAAQKNAENPNESAIVLKLTYHSIDFLLMSDVGAEQEKVIADKYSIESEVLKVAHHGSSSSSTLDFLKQANPEVSIITYSVVNDYGHPVKRVINNLLKLESQIFSTAAYGNIIVETDGNDYIVVPDMQPVERLIERLNK